MEKSEKQYYVEKGRYVTRGAIAEIIKILFIAALIIFIHALFLQPVDDTDKSRWIRSDVELITDHGTGVQYLYKNGSLIPRLDKSGQIVIVKR